MFPEHVRVIMPHLYSSLSSSVAITMEHSISFTDRHRLLSNKLSFQELYFCGVLQPVVRRKSDLSGEPVRPWVGSLAMNAFSISNNIFLGYFHPINFAPYNKHEHSSDLPCISAKSQSVLIRHSRNNLSLQLASTLTIPLAYTYLCETKHVWKAMIL